MSHTPPCRLQITSHGHLPPPLYIGIRHLPPPLYSDIRHLRSTCYPEVGREWNLHAFNTMWAVQRVADKQVIIKNNSFLPAFVIFAIVFALRGMMYGTFQHTTNGVVCNAITKLRRYTEH